MTIKAHSIKMANMRPAKSVQASVGLRSSGGALRFCKRFRWFGLGFVSGVLASFFSVVMRHLTVLYGRTSLSFPPDRISSASTRAALRRGFTLIELIVVIVIIVILVAIALPAIMAAREAARRVECANHGRNLGFANLLHEESRQCFPGNGGHTADSTILGVDGYITGISTYDVEARSLFKWGIGQPGASPKEQPGSWGFAVLPYIEQGDLYNKLDVEIQPSMFLCPSRARARALPTIDDPWARYVSGGWGWAKTDYAGNRNVMLDLGEVVRLKDVTDGLSNTILLGEKSFNSFAHPPTSWFWDEPVFSGGSYSAVRNGVRILRDDQADFRWNWGSAHSGDIAMFVGCDGAIHWLSFDMSEEVLDVLCGIQDKQVTSWR